MMVVKLLYRRWLSCRWF